METVAADLLSCSANSFADIPILITMPFFLPATLGNREYVLWWISIEVYLKIKLKLSLSIFYKIMAGKSSEI
jgi:hypothetical protein